MTAKQNCPLCELDAAYYGEDPTHDVRNVECRRCGRYKITWEALESLQPKQKPLLSAYARRTASRHNVITILSTNINDLINSLPVYSPVEKLDNVLELMAERTPRLGENAEFEPEFDYPLLVLQNPSELNYLVRVLLERKHLTASGGRLQLTMTGWEHLQELRRSGRSLSRAFVAMWFDPSMDEIYGKAIEPAIREARYEPLRIDKSEHVNRIDDEIIGQIRRARYMVADFTGQRHGVYFEAGMMLGLGRNVIWMAHQEAFDASGGLHFDVRQFNFIAYKDADDARTRLYNRILAIEGEGPLATNQH